MCILGTGEQDRSRGGTFLILVFGGTLAAAWLSIALLAMLG